MVWFFMCDHKLKKFIIIVYPETCLYMALRLVVSPSPRQDGDGPYMYM